MNHAPSTAVARPPHCPRCGFDLRSRPAAWTDRCPLDDTCVECGLRFAWCDVIGKGALGPPWFVETAPRWRFFPLRVMATALCTLVPWLFWGSVKMGHKARPWRRPAFTVGLGLLLYATIALTLGFHVGAMLARQGTPPTQVAFTSAYIVAMPLSNDPPTIYRAGFGSGMPPPRDLYAQLVRGGVNVQRPLMSILAGRKGMRLPRDWAHSAALLLLLSPAFVATPLAFVLLPQSRRKAKVRWGHIARITAYGLVPWLMLVSTSAAFYLATGEWSQPWRRVVELREHLVWLVPAWLFLWWWSATARYLRMPHAAAVAATAVVIGMAVGPALVVLAWWSMVT